MTATITKAGESREGETRAHIFAELTEAEAREVAFRGFPRGADVRYFLKPGADAAKEFALTRWTRIAPGAGE